VFVSLLNSAKRLERLRADFAKATAEHHVSLARSIDGQIAEAESDVADLVITLYMYSTHHTSFDSGYCLCFQAFSL